MDMKNRSMRRKAFLSGDDPGVGDRRCCWCGSRPAHIATGYCKHGSKVIQHLCCDSCKKSLSGEVYRKATHCSQGAKTDCDVVKFSFSSL